MCIAQVGSFKQKFLEETPHYTQNYTLYSNLTFSSRDYHCKTTPIAKGIIDIMITSLSTGCATRFRVPFRK